jgi:hypothetical protein
MCKADEKVIGEFRRLIDTIIKTVDESEWAQSVFRTEALRQLALVVIPDQFEWELCSTVDGKASFILTGYRPTLQEITNVH